MSWYAIVFSHDQIAGLEHVKVEDEFDLLYASAGNPKGMSLFELKTFPVHPLYYITPGSVLHVPRIMEHYEVVPCRTPRLTELTLLAGDPNAANSFTAAGEQVKPLRPGDPTWRGAVGFRR